MSDSASTDSTPDAVTFADIGLPKAIVTALARKGIDAPFAIQTVTIPDALAGHDVLGRASTGSGKTMAFGLPLIARLAGGRPEPKRPRGLVLVPTRELAMQVHDALEPVAHSVGVKIKLISGGMAFGRQVESLRRGVDILIATPGRLTDLIQQGYCSLEDIEVVVLDEADHLCDLGFMPAITALLDMTPSDSQRLLFSATLDGDVDKLVRKYLHKPVTHSIAPPTGSVTTMEHHLFVVNNEDKFDVASEIAARDGLTIMFVRTKHGADRLAKQLRGRGVSANALHGGRTQSARTKTLAEFRDGKVPVLVATDVAARGIHVDDVSLVVHVDPPTDPKAYLHRAGRTARAGESGVVVTLVTPSQKRSVTGLAKAAGVDAAWFRARPGDSGIGDITGGRAPSGIALAEPVEKPDRHERSQRFTDRGARSRRMGSSSGSSERSTSDRPRTARPVSAERTERPRSDRPRTERPSTSDRSERPRGERTYSDRPASSDRPERSYNSRPSSSNGERSYNSRPSNGSGERSYNSRPSNGSGERTYNSRPSNSNGERSYNSRPSSSNGERSYNSRPSNGSGERTYNSRPSSSNGERSYNARPSNSDRPRSERPTNGSGERSYNSRPSNGDRSRGPRPASAERNDRSQPHPRREVGADAARPARKPRHGSNAERANGSSSRERQDMPPRGSFKNNDRPAEGRGAAPASSRPKAHRGQPNGPVRKNSAGKKGANKAGGYNASPKRAAAPKASKGRA